MHAAVIAGRLVSFGSAAILATATVTATRSADAAPGNERRPVDLVVERAPGLETCPDKTTMRELIAARLGYDPVVAGATTVLVVTFASEPPAIRAQLDRRTGSDRRGTRVMRSETGDCAELASSVALAAALAIDPESSTRPVSAAPSPPPPPPPPKPTAPPPSAPRGEQPAPEKATPKRLVVGAGPVVGAGYVPGISAGPRLDVALRSGAFSLELQGTALVEGSQVVPAGTVSASAFLGSLLPCFRWSSGARWSGDVCAEGQVGGLFASAGRVDRSEPTAAVLAAVGPRSGLSLALGEHLELRFSAAVVAQLSRVHLFIDDAGRSVDVWTTPPAAFLIGLEPLLLLP